jgi:hypothetical protein
MHEGAGGAVSGDDGVGWIRQLIFIYPYVPSSGPRVDLVPKRDVREELRKTIFVEAVAI